MSKKLLQTASVFALSALTATWFIGAKGAFGGQASAKGQKPVGISKVLSKAKQAEEAWRCYPGNTVQTKDPALYAELASSEIGRDAIAALIYADPKICTGSVQLYKSKFGHDSGAMYDTLENAMYFRIDVQDTPYKTDVQDTPNKVHEIGHARKTKATNNVYFKLMVQGSFTSFLQASLVDEAGSIAEECILAYQQMMEGTSDDYRLYETLPEDHTHRSMARVMNRLMDKNKAMGRILANKNTPVPAEFMDLIVGSFLKEPGIKFHLNDNARQLWSFYKDVSDRIDPDFAPSLFNENEVCLLAVGNKYGNGEVFPHTAEALGDLGLLLESFAKQVITKAQSTSDIEKMTDSFVSKMNSSSRSLQASTSSTRPSLNP